MMIVYSKQTGDIKTVATGDMYKSLKDLYPKNYIDYDIIYDFLIMNDNNLIINNFGMFKVVDGKLVQREIKI